MKYSILGVVCAGIALAVGTANPAAAASLTGGHNLGGINASCHSSGPGSGFLNQDTAGCSEYISSGSVQMLGSGVATYDSLRASASVGASALNTSGPLATALGQARSTDSLTIDIFGRTGELVDLVFEAAMHGNLSASGDPAYVYAQADALISVNIGTARASIGRIFSNLGDPILNGINPGRVQIQLGTPFTVISTLTVKARLEKTGGLQFLSGDAIANFGSTAGITSFMLFEPGTGGALIPEWNLASESGEFGFYTAVPAPATIWLLATGMGLLASRVKRKAKA